MRMCQCCLCCCCKNLYGNQKTTDISEEKKEEVELPTCVTQPIGFRMNEDEDYEGSIYYGSTCSTYEPKPITRQSTDTLNSGSTVKQISLHGSEIMLNEAFSENDPNENTVFAISGVMDINGMPKEVHGTLRVHQDIDTPAINTLSRSISSHIIYEVPPVPVHMKNTVTNDCPALPPRSTTYEFSKPQYNIPYDHRPGPVSTRSKSEPGYENNFINSQSQTYGYDSTNIIRKPIDRYRKNTASATTIPRSHSMGAMSQRAPMPAPRSVEPSHVYEEIR